jgi:hypothetical protein
MSSTIRGYSNNESAAPDWPGEASLRAILPLGYIAMANWKRPAPKNPYWNAAQKRACPQRTIHNYMRMYWASELLRWFSDPAEPSPSLCSSTTHTRWTGGIPRLCGVAWCFEDMIAHGPNAGLRHPAGDDAIGPGEKIRCRPLCR